jgi:hypothetical protein
MIIRVDSYRNDQSGVPLDDLYIVVENFLNKILTCWPNLDKTEQQRKSSTSMGKIYFWTATIH